MVNKANTVCNIQWNSANQKAPAPSKKFHYTNIPPLNTLCLPDLLYDYEPHVYKPQDARFYQFVPDLYGQITIFQFPD